MAPPLYIIGNGFDLHHRIPSSYTDFGNYLKRVDPKTYDIAERYLGIGSRDWYDLEESLAGLDINLVLEDASEFLISYASEDWSESANHDYQAEISGIVTAISVTIPARFREWLLSLSLPTTLNPRLRLNLDPAGTYLNFNYTPTLQRLYDIKDHQIRHIHSSLADTTGRLILGHGYNPDKPYSAPYDKEETDTRVLEGARIIDRYFNDTFKPTRQIIDDNRGFFTGLAGTKLINVMGHALAPVDHPYFREIIRHVDPNAQWRVSYHRDPNETRQRVAALGIPLASVQIIRLDQF